MPNARRCVGETCISLRPPLTVMAGLFMRGRMCGMTSVDVSAAVVLHLSQYPFWTDDARAAIARDAGQSGLQLVQEAHTFAAYQEDLWLGKTYETAWRIVKDRIAQRYPQFSTDAVECIARLAAYEWK